MYKSLRCLSFLMVGLLMQQAAFGFGLKVLSVEATEPQAVSQKTCKKWFKKNLNIREKKGDVAANETSLSLSKDATKGLIRVNGRTLEVTHVDFTKNADNVTVTTPTLLILPVNNKRDKYKDKIGYLSMKYCTALVEPRRGKR